MRFPLVERGNFLYSADWFYCFLHKSLNLSENGSARALAAGHPCFAAFGQCAQGGRIRRCKSSWPPGPCFKEF